MQRLLYVSIIFATLFAASCSDNDETAEFLNDDPYGKYTEEGNAVLSALQMLADVDSLPNNWKTATFEPTIGDVTDEANPYVRSYVVSDRCEARSFFLALTGVDVTDTLGTATAQTEDMKFVYTGSASSNLFATIDISMRQMPHLVQLRLIPMSAAGDNAPIFEGQPYYKVGDVILADDGCYWICVKQAVSDKNDSRWCTLQLTSENYKYRSTDESNVNCLPWQLGSNLDDVERFSELMYLMKNGNQDDNYKSSHSFDVAYLRSLHNIFYSYLAEILIPKGFGSTIEDRVENLFNGEQYVFYKGYTSTFFGGTYYPYYAWINGEYKQKAKEFDLSLAMAEYDAHEYAMYGKKGNVSKIRIANAYVLRAADGETLFKLSKSNVSSYTPTKSMNPYNDVFLSTKDSYYKIVPEDYTKRGHYQFGDIMTDQNGDRWFCLIPSGAIFEGAGSKSPYSIFITFDTKGIKTQVETDGTVVATNLMPKKITANILCFITQLTQGLRQGEYPTGSPDLNAFYRMLYEELGVNFSDVCTLRLNKNVKPEKGSDRSAFVSTISAAYKDGNGMSIMRVTDEITAANPENGQSYPRFIIHTVYPKIYKIYDNTLRDYVENVKYTDVPMKLSDIANQQRVDEFAQQDTLVTKANLYTDYVDKGIVVRKSVSQAAKDVRNYYYKDNFSLGKNSAWTAKCFDGVSTCKNNSMFNDNLVIIRACRLYDCGNETYKRISADGQYRFDESRIKLFKEFANEHGVAMLSGEIDLAYQQWYFASTQLGNSGLIKGWPLCHSLYNGEVISGFYSWKDEWE